MMRLKGGIGKRWAETRFIFAENDVTNTLLHLYWSMYRCMQVHCVRGVRAARN